MSYNVMFYLMERSDSLVELGISSNNTKEIYKVGR